VGSGVRLDAVMAKAVSGDSERCDTSVMVARSWGLADAEED
jgi:hypothetical protein